MILKDIRDISLLPILLIVVLAVTSCTTTQPSEPTNTPEVLKTATIEPSPTPTLGPGEVLLHVPEPLQASAQDLEIFVIRLADEQGLIVREVGADIEASLTPETRLVVHLAELNGIDNVAHSHPEIGFIVFGEPPSPADNVVSIRPPTHSNDQTGFLAGYVAAMTTADYRVGGIALESDGAENAALQGFINGVIFYCGLCRPNYPPFNSYPQSQFVASAEPAPVLASVQAMVDLGVSTVYLAPELNQPEIFEVLESTGARFIGSAIPNNPTGLGWVASIAPDLESGIEQAWDEWLSGDAQDVIEPSLSIYGVDEELVSPGKLAHIKEVIDDLASGRIATGVDPLTGEVR